MTHTRFRGCVAWAMVAIGAIAIVFHDMVAVVWIAILVILIASFAPVISNMLGGD